MASVPPLVRDFVLCEDMIIDPANPTKITLVNLIYAIQSTEEPPYPVSREQLCVYAALTGGHGSGRIEIEVISAETLDVLRYAEIATLDFGNDPLRLYGVPVRLRNCIFPEPGWYSVHLLFEGTSIAEKQLLLR